MFAASGCLDASPSREGSKVHARADRPEPLQPIAIGKPIRLAILTDLHGVLEACGCTRTSAGGADRIAALLKELRRDDPQLLFVVAGDSLFPASGAEPGLARADAQDRLKADAWGGLLRSMRVDVISPGPRDLARGASALVDLAHQSSVAVVGTQRIDGLDRLAPRLVRSTGSRRIALVADDASAGADLTILFRHGEPRLDEPAAGADLVIHTGLTPPRSFASLRDGVLHVSAGGDGEELLLLELWPEAGPGVAWQLVSGAPSAGKHNRARVERHRLTQEWPSDPEVRRLLDQLFARINAQNRELRATSLTHVAKRPGAHEPPAFMGSRTCAACHTEAYFAWRETPHARAYQTLVARGRELDLDCISCHVTGFDQPRGAALGHLEELRGVGCESCHGPGEAHVNNPRIKQRTVQRAVPEAECRVCHDPEHSDAFDYAEKRKRLLTPGHGVK